MAYKIATLPTMDAKSKVHLEGFTNYKEQGKQKQCMRMVIGHEYVNLNATQLKHLGAIIEELLKGTFNSEVQYTEHLHDDIQLGDDIFVDCVTTTVRAIVTEWVHHDEVNGVTVTRLSDVISANRLNNQTVGK